MGISNRMLAGTKSKVTCTSPWAQGTALWFGSVFPVASKAGPEVSMVTPLFWYLEKKLQISLQALIS